ncbi:hypothetical protein E7T06_18150 [Deinococcus sp. Arct2-2]|uniref:hypothetical protein n=1 Tax=Deinococcus sp. Arct2-2 TaxID=2568653 RepID=UPI0010A3E9B1|nr:hypothetical protein [Deinococcus sp. Arct2-2]THF68109.1 hypothetical protein E7T06_18150 [Deinococcus sp. Arct2-2]
MTLNQNSFALFEFLNTFSAFRIGALRLFEELSDREGAQIERFSDHVSITPSLAYKAVNLSQSVGVDLKEGAMHWTLNVRSNPEVLFVTANLVANYPDEPYQTILRQIGHSELQASDFGFSELTSIVEDVLSDIKSTLISKSLSELHRQGASKPFFPNL